MLITGKQVASLFCAARSFFDRNRCR